MASYPASMTTATPGLASVINQLYYNRVGMDRLQKKFMFRKPCDPENLPLNEGRTGTWFRWDNLTANTTPTTEGTVGTGLTISANALTATVSQFTNFISLSDFLVQTGPSPLVSAASELLGYRAGLTVDTLTRLVIDNEYASVALTPGATYLRRGDLATARGLLQGVDVKPFEDGRFLAISHPYNTYDLINDPNVLGYPDTVKYTMSGGGAMNSAPDRGNIVDTGYCNVWESTNVKQTGSQYDTYVFGKGGVAYLNLQGNGPTNLVDPEKERFKIKVFTSSGGPWDPEGVIAATVAYNFKTTAFVKDGPAPIGGTYRYKIIRAASTIA